MSELRGGRFGFDTLTAYSRGHPRIRARAREYRARHGRVTITSMTVFERLRGYHLALARGKPYEQSLRAFEALVATCKVIPLDPAAAGLAGRIWAALDRSHRAALGHIFIAACAGTQRLRLVTRSRKAQ